MKSKILALVVGLGLTATAAGIAQARKDIEIVRNSAKATVETAIQAARALDVDAFELTLDPKFAKGWGSKNLMLQMLGYLNQSPAVAMIEEKLVLTITSENGKTDRQWFDVNVYGLNPSKPGELLLVQKRINVRCDWDYDYKNWYKGTKSCRINDLTQSD